MKKLLTQAQWAEMAQYVSPELMEKKYTVHLTEKNCLDYPVFGVPLLKRCVQVKDLAEGTPGVYSIEQHGKVVYVGQSECLYRRFCSHEHAVGKSGVVFNILHLSDCEIPEHRLELEKAKIIEYLQEGYPLLNSCKIVDAFRRRND